MLRPLRRANEPDWDLRIDPRRLDPVWGLDVVIRLGELDIEDVPARGPTPRSRPKIPSEDRSDAPVDADDVLPVGQLQPALGERKLVILQATSGRTPLVL
jgi:hypothetical protein